METASIKPVVNTTESGVRTERLTNPITVDRLYKNEFQKPGTMTVQLRQVVETKSFYPAQRVNSDLQNNIFGASDFNFSEQEFQSKNTRMSWLLVPEKATIAEIEAKVREANTKGACIYRVLSNQPILDENQKYAVTAKVRTLDFFANNQVVRYPETDANKNNGTAGKIWLDQKGQVQYRRTFFWNSPKEDIDERGKLPEYFTPEIKAELAGASSMQGQALM